MNAPSDLFGQQPIRSDFSNRMPPKKRRHPLRPVWIALLCAIIGGGVYYWGFSGPKSPEEIPTIKAEGPAKERPEQPGGLDIPHQDMLVFQQIEGSDKSAKGAAVEHLLPPPEMPQAQALPPPVVTSPSPPESLMKPASSEGNAIPTPPPAPIQAQAVAKGAAPSPPPHVAPLPVEAPAPVAKIEEKPAIATTVVGKTAPQPVQPSPIVAAAPASVPVSPVAAAPAPVASVAPATVPPAKQASKPQPAQQAQLPKELFTNTEKAAAAPKAESLSGSAAHIQLASVTDAAAAEKIKAQLQSKFASKLGDVTLRVVRADLPGKGVYYRIQGGVASEAEARRICSQISASGSGCILAK